MEWIRFIHSKRQETTLSNMKLAAALAACVTAPVMAQSGSNVALYGILDIALRTQSGLTAGYARSPANSTVLASGVGPTSRWGVRGTEDLGGGLRATFNLESGINADTGNPANAATYFDRACVVGLAGSWGGVTAGRQNTLLADSAGVVDPIGLRFAGLNPNIQVTSLTGHQLGIEFGSTGSTGASNRLNNSIKYSVPVGPVVGRVMYSLGEAAGSTSKSSASGLGLDYLSHNLDLTSAYMRFKDANDRTLTAANIGIGWRTGPVKLVFNLGRNNAQTSATAETSNRVVAGGVNYAVTPLVDVIAGYYKVDRTRTALSDDGFKRLIAFVEYKFSRRTKVYLELDNTRWKGDYLGAGNKSTSNGLSLGITHAF
jgi:predicted porin